VNSGDNTLHYPGDTANAAHLAYVSNCATDATNAGQANNDGMGVCDEYCPTTGQTVFAASSGSSHSTPALAALLHYTITGSKSVTASPPALWERCFTIF
jgi:hypothetical protein